MKIFTKNRNNNLALGIYIVFVVVFLIALGPYLKLQAVATLALLPSLAFIGFMFDLKTITQYKTEFLIFAVIYILSLATVFYYIDYDEFSRNLSSMFGAVIGAFVAIALTSNKNYEDYFHVGYVLSILALFAIMYVQGNIDPVNFASQIAFRDRFLLNANFYSYISVFANFSLFYLYLKYRSKLLFILLATMPLLLIIMAFTTQSRQGLLLIILMNLCFWGFVVKAKAKSQLTKLLRFIVFIFFVSAIGYQVYNIYQNSRIKNRVTSLSNEEDARELIFIKAIEIFSEHPIIGVGLGQFPKVSGWGKFSHNSYSEILSEQGIIGGILLFIMFGRPSIQSFRNFRELPKNEFARCNLLFFMIFLLYNNAYVFYKFPFSMMYFFLIIGIQYKFTREHQESLVDSQTPASESFQSSL